MLDSAYTQKFNHLLKEKIPFAIFKKPNSTTIELQIFEEKQISTFNKLTELKNKKGFLFAPFHPKTGKSAFFFPKFLREEFDLQSLIKNSNNDRLISLYLSDTLFNKGFSEEYSNNFKAFQNAFSPKFKKAILSKIITRPIDGLNIPEYFIKIAQKYPNAFVYYIQSEKTSSWLGATPETLISTQKDNYEIMSLAGTSKNATWTEKEIKEQEYVTDYISDLLHKYKIHNFTKSEVENHKAGNFYHLKTTFLIPKDNIIDKLGDFVKDLHPTPAVCGLPKQESLDLILQTENHKREYYTGYLGTIDSIEKLDLFVNLRCMKIEKHIIKVFVGGGITSDSKLEAEWLETEMKAGILLDLI